YHPTSIDRSIGSCTQLFPPLRLVLVSYRMRRVNRGLADDERNGCSGMWYFAYGSNLNARAVAEWCRHHGHRPPALKGGKPCVLDNSRLCFPIFSEYWGGGIGDIIYDPGKYVAGAVFDLSETDMKVLDAKVGRKLEGDKEAGIYKQIEVKIAPLGKGEP